MKRKIAENELWTLGSIMHCIGWDIDFQSPDCACTLIYHRRTNSDDTNYRFRYCKCMGLTEQTLQCQHCQHKGFHEIIKNGPHIEIKCNKCQKHIRYVRRVTIGLIGKRKTIPHNERHKLKTTVRARILLRDKSTCQLCGATNTQLHVDHKQSVDHAIKQGWQSTDINADNNLWTLCETCNLGKKANCLPPCPECDPRWKEACQ